MGVFTGLAIAGLAVSVAGQYARSRQQSKALAAQPPLAPGPVETRTAVAKPGTVSALTPPAPPVLDPAANEQAAQLAATTQRKRAASGSILTRPPVSSTQPVTRKKTLIGAY